MKKTKYIIYVLLAVFSASCADDELLMPEMTPEQEALIGRAVNFNVSIADEFQTRATSYTSYDDGKFNQNDRMRIFRNYLGTDGQWESEDVYRTYYLKHNFAGGTISLGVDWVPEIGRKGYDDKDNDGTYETFTQTAADSLTWDNGKTLRFRAWSQSNFYNILNNATKSYFYPDFCIADWVNASGPTEGIPLVLKHKGSRIVFKIKQSGNQIQKVEICANINPDGSARTDGWKDYKYADNAYTTENDNSATEAGKSDEQAKEECEKVTDVYKQMCMPAGVDMNTGTLKAVNAASWSALTDDQVKKLEEQSDGIFINYGASDDIATTAKRPFFCGINGSHYMITIPYAMNGTNKGEVLVLPACTRFRVYMYDVNNGDGFGTTGYEGKYHVFSLADIVERDASGNIVKDSEGNPIKLFPDGLKMTPGVSYTFTVGYRYNSLYVVPEKSMSWTEQDINDAQGEDEAAKKPETSTSEYTWWKTAIKTAIDNAASTGSDYKPEFSIGSEKELFEFINLVNGTAATKTSGLYRLKKTVTDENGTQTTTYGWSLNNSQFNPQWIEESEAEAMGYIFYDRYYPANADQAAYSERDYLKGPFPFYDENLRMNFGVTLTADLDMKDWQIESIGNSASNPFMGSFDGGGHTIKNLNMKDEYLFGYIDGKAPEGAAITNLKIESTHNTGLLKTGVNPVYIAGISLLAPSSSNSIAQSLSLEQGVSGMSYVVGCIHIGDAAGALVGSASKVNMFGCMQAAEGITGGALIGTDVNGAFVPQIKLSKQKTNTSLANSKPSFSTFMCNYYDTSLSPNAHAVGSTSDDYSLLEYIRGSTTDILRAKNDYLLNGVSMSLLLAQSNYYIYYGLAPWHAMNYAIYWYNTNRGSKHPCTMHYESNTVGYKHQYPVLVSGKQTASEVGGWNPIEQTN